MTRGAFAASRFIEVAFRLARLIKTLGIAFAGSRSHRASYIPRDEYEGRHDGALRMNSFRFSFS